MYSAAGKLGIHERQRLRAKGDTPDRCEVREGRDECNFKVKNSSIQWCWGQIVYSKILYALFDLNIISIWIKDVCKWYFNIKWNFRKKELTEEDTGAIIVKLTARLDMFLQRATWFWKIFQNKIKKLLTNRTTHDKISELSRLRRWTDRTKPIEKNF